MLVYQAGYLPYRNDAFLNVRPSAPALTLKGMMMRDPSGTGWSAPAVSPPCHRMLALGKCAGQAINIMNHAAEKTVKMAGKPMLKNHEI
jgi:hypothetical protein